MVATEIFLIAAGVICVVVSVVMSFGDDKAISGFCPL